MGGLVDVLDVELGDEGRLEGSTASGKFGGVEGSRVGGWSVDRRRFREDGAETLGDLGRVGRTTGKDNLEFKLEL
jgi:hypothetical protein